MPPGKPLAGVPMMALEDMPPGKPLAGVPMMALEDVPAGKPLAGEPMIALEDVPAGKPLAGEPMMALEDVPPGKPLAGEPMIAPGGVPAGRPLAGEPMMALEGALIIGWGVFDWARSPVTAAAMKAMGPNRISLSWARFDKPYACWFFMGRPALCLADPSSKFSFLRLFGP
jgi:hypothetical protein